MQFKKILKDIKDLKIQGAENVAIEALKAINEINKNSKTQNTKKLMGDLENARKLLIETRPTEPCMRNALFYVFHNLDKINNIHESKEYISKKIFESINHFELSKKIIAEIGSNKIRDGSVVFTHCHSSTVIEILKEAKRKGKIFNVHCMETRPLLQGRKTAKELAAFGIPVTYYIDSAARLALKKADIAFIGADSISSTGDVINKIGSELFTEIANKYEISVYSCTDSWKFNPRTIFGFDEIIEQRAHEEIWNNPPKNVKIETSAFEKVHHSLISGIISELGIFKPSVFVEEAKKAYPWMII